MFCRNCGDILTETEVVCHQCGFALGTGEHYCEQCGTPTPPYAVVCEVCGTPIEREELPPTAGQFAEAGQFAYAPPPQQRYPQQDNRQTANSYDRGQPAYGQPIYPPPQEAFDGIPVTEYARQQRRACYPRPNGNVQTVGTGQKSKRTAIVCGILLGMLGVHDFYLGHIGRGVVHLLMTCSGGAAFLSWIWAVIEIVQMLNDPHATDAQGLPLK